jgi:signal peptidase I
VRRAALALLLALVAFVLWLTRGFTRWPETYVGSGPSMEPTVRPGEYFSVTPLDDAGRAALERGALVVFAFDHEDTVYTVLRRLAALPGDTIVMEEGRIRVNGTAMPWPWRIREPRAAHSMLARTANLYTWGPIVVPPDSVFLLSDTRDVVSWPDSRFIGPVARSALTGVAGRYLWSPDWRRFLRRLR